MEQPVEVPVGGRVGVGSAPSGAIGSDEGRQFGRFRVLGVLGQGQHATVYRACDTILDRDVALKVPRRGCSGRPSRSSGSWARPGPGAAAAPPDRAGLRSGPGRRPALHRHGPDRGLQPGRTPGGGAGCRSGAPSRSSSTWPRHWPMPTARGSCTGMSSRPTSGLTTAATST